MKNLSIKTGYKGIPSPNVVKNYLALMRPYTLLAALFAGIFLTLLATKYYGLSFPWGIALLTGLTLGLLQSGGQVLNQSLLEEVQIDKENGKSYRPTVKGDISLHNAFFFSMSLFLLGIGLGVVVNPYFGLFALVIFFFAVSYTLPPFRIKKHFILNNIWQGVSRGLLPFIAVWGIYGNPLNPIPLCLGGVIALWITGAQTSKDFSDVIGDKKFGVKTLPVVLGEKKSLLVMLSLMQISFIVLAWFIWQSLLPLSFLFLLILALPSYLIFYSMKEKWKFEFLENSFSWGLFYLTLGLFFILPAVVI